MAVYRVGPFELHALRLTLRCGGKPVSLGAKVVETLLALVERSGQAVSKQALLDRIWPDGFVEQSNLAQNVYVLRKTFREHGVADAIATVAGVGYRLTVPVDGIAQGAQTAPVAIVRASLRRQLIAVAGAALAVLALLSPVATGSGTRASRTAALAGDDARLYAMGRYYWNLRTAVSVRKSMEYFTRVIEREPESPFGYVGMADANVTMGDYCYGAHRPSDYFARARAYVREALALDPRSVPAHATLGFILLHERKPLAAIAQLRRTVDADPAYGPAREWYAIALARENRVTEAWVQMRYAADLQPLSVSATAWLGSLADRRRNFGEGRLYARELRDMVSDFQRPSHPRGHPTWASIEASAEAEIARGGD